MAHIGQHSTKLRPEEREIIATARVVYSGAEIAIRLKDRRRELEQVRFRLQAQPPVDPEAHLKLESRSSATRGEVSQQDLATLDLERREAELMLQIWQLQRQETESLTEWRAANKRQLAADRDAELRAEFDRQERLSREQRFADFKRLKQGRS